jgi:uncharacterized protein with ParB-like and HNH nuclease domain
VSPSPSNKIDADSHSIEAVFTRFYAVPDFQREYIWKTRHVNKLLEDLHIAFTSKDVDSYFLGSIVFYDEDDISHLVDGQQRMTTLFILVSAIRDRLKELNPTADLTLYAQALRAPYKAKTGGTAYQYRVVLQYPDISKILQEIGDGKAVEIALPKGESPRRNLLTAYKLCSDFLVEEFGDDEDRLDAFFTFLWRDVELITIHTVDMRTAFTIFETINDRGVGLDAMDLLKNLLFRQTPSAATRNELAEQWKLLLKTLRSGGESKPIRFLRYYLIATNDFERVPTAKGIFDWITTAENKKKLGYGKNPTNFAQKLVEAAEAYANFGQGLDEDGNDSPPLKAINFQRTGVRQHLCLLLAARNLSGSAFGELCSWLESLVFVYAVTNAQWNEIEKALPGWTKTLRAARTKADVDDFVAKSLLPQILSRMDQFKAKLEDTSSMPNRLKRYMLASLTQYLEDQCGKGGDLDKYFKENLTIEHIFPQSTTAEKPRPAAIAWIKAFKPVKDPAFYVHRLGNLTLLHRGPNSSGADSPFKPTKLATYKKSNYDLTRALAEDLKVGKATKITKTVEKYGLHPYSSWSPVSVEERHKMLLTMAEEYWQIPLTNGSLRQIGAA